MAVLPGLPAPLPRWKQAFAWSVRRHEQWQRCRRLFYYDAVAPTLPRPPVPAHAFERLRRLSPVSVVKGLAVHAALEQGITESLAGRDPLGPALRTLDASLRPHVLRPQDTLVEAALGRAPGSEAIEAARADGRRSVEAFFAGVWPRYAGRRYLQHERYGRFATAGGQRVTLRVDLVTGGPEGLRITDWKTGKDRGDAAASSLQLSTYLLWATKALGEPPERLRAELVFLPDGTARETARTAEQLQATELAIQASAGEMLGLGGLADAAPSPGPHCGECRFASICEAGRERLGLP